MWKDKPQAKFPPILKGVLFPWVLLVVHAVDGAGVDPAGIEQEEESCHGPPYGLCFA